MKRRSEGLTLLEVLIALAVLALSLTAIVKATTVSVRETRYLRDKTIALWVAKKTLRQIQLDLITDHSPHLEMTTHMLGSEWFWTSDITSTKNSAIDNIEVTVRRKRDEPALIVLNGFKAK